MPEPTHDEMLLRIADLAMGRIAAEEAAAIRAHVVSCDECGRQMRTYEIVAEVVREEAVSAAHHPGADELVAFALRSGGSATETAAEITAHLDSCAGCREEVEIVRGAEADLVRASRFGDAAKHLGTGVAPWRTRYALLAAGVVSAALLYPAYVGLVRYPEEADLRATLHEENTALRHRLASFETRESPPSEASEPLVVHFLHAATRGVGDVTKIEFPGEARPDDPVLAIEPWIGAEDRAGDDVRLEILGREMETLWASAVPATAAHDALRASEGVLFFRVPASVLSPGVYRLVQRDAEGHVRVEYPFVVVESNQRPEATKAPQ